MILDKYFPNFSNRFLSTVTYNGCLRCRISPSISNHLFNHWCCQKNQMFNAPISCLVWTWSNWTFFGHHCLRSLFTNSIWTNCFFLCCSCNCYRSLDYISMVVLLWPSHQGEISHKSIKRFRAIDVNSLFGYMGGYVGVLVGFSILQIPDLLLETFDRIKRLGSCIIRE